jgi:hypothetical protein
MASRPLECRCVFKIFSLDRGKYKTRHADAGLRPDYRGAAANRAILARSEKAQNQAGFAGVQA